MKKLFISLVCILTATAGARCTELFNLDFTPPELGIYEKVFGNPTVQPTVGPFTDALLFQAVSTYEQIRLGIYQPGPQYNISYDVFAHNLVNSRYAFTMLLDTPQVRNVALNGAVNDIDVVQPFVGNFNIGTLVNDQVYHFDISVNLLTDWWTVAVNGIEKYAHSLIANGLESIRFSMAPVVVDGASVPGTYVALDNVRVTVVPEPSVTALALVGLGCLASVRLQRRTRLKS